MSQERSESYEMPEDETEAQVDQASDTAASNNTSDNDRRVRCQGRSSEPANDTGDSGSTARRPGRECARLNSDHENDSPPSYDVAVEKAPSYEDVVKHDGEQYI